MTKNRIYVDFDGCIVNTIKRITEMYNEDFKYYKCFKEIHWTDINSWDFKECTCATGVYFDYCFTQPRFFEGLEYIDNAKEVLDRLSKKHEIVIVSMGIHSNLKGKEIWIKENIPYAKFVGVSFTDYYDKSHIDMSDGILFLDDNSSNLNTNAEKLAVFGDVYEWNKDWEGIRLHNWYDVEKFLIERGN